MTDKAVSPFEQLLEAIADKVADKLAAKDFSSSRVVLMTSYTRKEAAQRMNIPVGQVDKLRNTGRLRFDKFGGNVRILEADIVDFYKQARRSKARARLDNVLS